MAGASYLGSSGSRCLPGATPFACEVSVNGPFDGILPHNFFPPARNLLSEHDCAQEHSSSEGRCEPAIPRGIFQSVLTPSGTADRLSWP